MDKVADVKNEICSAETKARHPELFHYTKPAAFEAIVKSQTLWCSHYREMRDDKLATIDHKECETARELLPPAVAPLMDELIEKNFNRHNRRLWDKSGRGIQTARDVVNSLYGATYDGKAKYSALEPYIISFSTHSDDTAAERAHGLLSQWKAYAGPEGYCLVFDTAVLADMLKTEGTARYWAWLMVRPARYADEPIEQIFPELVFNLADTLRQFLQGVKYPEAATRDFLIGTTLLKDASYKSEREVRIVAIPGTERLAKLAAKEFPREFDATAPVPSIKFRPNSDKHYVALFDGLGLRLPIKRIIVGPGARQDERTAFARSLFGDAPVTKSNCVADF
jgi:hypothetical protein